MILSMQHSEFQGGDFMLTQKVSCLLLFTASKFIFTDIPNSYLGMARKYRTQNVEVAKYRNQNIEVAKYRKEL